MRVGIGWKMSKCCSGRMTDGVNGHFHCLGYGMHLHQRLRQVYIVSKVGGRRILWLTDEWHDTLRKLNFFLRVFNLLVRNDELDSNLCIVELH